MSVTLRPYQDGTIEGTREAFRRGAKRVACVLPTGSGKTTIFGSMCKQFKDSGVQGKAAIISHLGLLTSQTGQRFLEEYGLHSEVLQADRLPSSEAQTVITTMQSFRSEEKLLKWADKLSFGIGSLERLNIKLIIIDECHLVGNDSYDKILKMFPDAYVIGFTATPFRKNKLMTNLFDEVAYTISTQELIDQGYLVPPVLNGVNYNTHDQAEMFAKIINIYKERHNGHKAVVYLKTIAEAELLRNVLVDAGISASAVTSKLTGKLRDGLLKDFRKGDGPDILTTVDVLTAGFDSPNLRAIFMPYKVGSVTTYLQRVGRGLRPDTAKTHCDIYVGSDAPGIEPGFWEKVQKKMLNAGRKDYDNLEDLLEYGENDFSVEEYQWTKDVVAMANAARKKGMETFYDMVVHKRFPEAMLERFVSSPPMTTKRGAKTKPTKAQKAYLSNRGLYAEGLTKQECSAIIDSHRRANGWTPSQEEIVPSGKHKGKLFSEVPPMYWKIIAKYKSPVYLAYTKWKEGLRG
jgi:superfamily II DNA or RNA helicase